MDGQKVAVKPGSYQEGDIIAANIRPLGATDSTWSPEGVYKVTGDKLIYDPAGTKERHAVSAADPTQLGNISEGKFQAIELATQIWGTCAHRNLDAGTLMFAIAILQINIAAICKKSDEEVSDDISKAVMEMRQDPKFGPQPPP